jgi:hypothetical protein
MLEVEGFLCGVWCVDPLIHMSGIMLRLCHHDRVDDMISCIIRERCNGPFAGFIFLIGVYCQDDVTPCFNFLLQPCLEINYHLAKWSRSVRSNQWAPWYAPMLYLPCLGLLCKQCVVTGNFGLVLILMEF